MAVHIRQKSISVIRYGAFYRNREANHYPQSILIKKYPTDLVLFIQSIQNLHQLACYTAAG